MTTKMVKNQIIEFDNNLSFSKNLQLSKIIIREDYQRKWNISCNDFLVLTKEGKLLRATLYRIGGLNDPDLEHDRYFMLLKYVESFYPKEIMKMSKSKDNKHLEGKWCILDKEGNEKVEFDSFKNPYLIKNSCIYSINSNYFNVETGEFYCYSHNSFESENYLFLNNEFDKNKSKRGVLKIDKISGKMELFH